MRRFLSILQKIFFLKRLIPSVLRRLPFNKSINVKINNFYINLNLESSIDRYIFLKGFYDKKKIDYIESKINPKKFDYFIDIGSNIGFYSLYFASKFKNLNVLAFEPIQENYEQILKSVETNNFKKFEVFKYALSNKTEIKTMWVTNMKKKSGFSVYEDKDYKNETKMNNYDTKKIFKRSVKSEVFDDIFKIKNKNVFIKIDVERHEFQCISGMTNLLQKSNNKIFLQVEIAEMYKNSVLNLLKKMNFSVLNIIEPEAKKNIHGSDYYLANF